MVLGERSGIECLRFVHRLQGPFLSEPGMFLLYLDQCAISRFLDGKKNEEWSEVRSLVLWGNESRRLLCPGSLEHMYETASLNDERAIALDQLLRRLSFGWSLCTRTTPYRATSEFSVAPANRDKEDDTRIANALPYADILITDGVKASNRENVLQTIER